MGLKSKVRTHTETTNATLTTRGREILSREGKIDVTKFILSDEEIDYTLWDNKHPDGTKHYGKVLEDTPLLEATPNRTKFNSQILPDDAGLTEAAKSNVQYWLYTLPPRTRYQINIPTLHYPRASWEALIGIHPTSTQRIKIHAHGVPESVRWDELTTTDLSEEYIFTIENTNVVRFTRYYVGAYETNPWLNASDIPGSGDVIQAKGIEFQPQQMNPKATTTITVQGKISGLTKVVSIQVIPKDDINIFAGASPVDVTDPKFY
jgi:hypothetical protein